MIILQDNIEYPYDEHFNFSDNLFLFKHSVIHVLTLTVLTDGYLYHTTLVSSPAALIVRCST